VAFSRDLIGTGGSATIPMHLKVLYSGRVVFLVSRKIIANSDKDA
jgi:hypothetical protein